MCGLNLGVDFLPGSFGYDGSRPAWPQEAARVLWLDACTANVDHTWSTPNLLVWHGQTWAIDHGAALNFHHSWPTRGSDPARFAGQPFDASKHVLPDVADHLSPMHDDLAAIVRASLLDGALGQVPDAWLQPTEAMPDAEAVRTAYRLALLLYQGGGSPARHRLATFEPAPQIWGGRGAIRVITCAHHAFAAGVGP